MHWNHQLAATKQRAHAAEHAQGVTAGGAIKLPEFTPGAPARVVAVVQADRAGPPELGRRLAELGFLPGEAVRVVARGFPAREPIAVRVGTGTFALRLFEAACIRVCPEQTPAR